MSTVAFALPPSPNPFRNFAGGPSPKPAPSRRQPTPQQGRALETLGHAIEYLVDSRLFDQWESSSDAEAVHLLMACSRSVFAECGEVYPWHQRVQRAFAKRLSMQGLHIR